MPAALDGITRRVRKPRAEPGLLKIRLANLAAAVFHRRDALPPP